MTTPRPPRIAYTPAEVAQMLGIATRTVYKLTSTGELPSIRIGTAVRIPVTEFDAYVERLKAAS